MSELKKSPPVRLDNATFLKSLPKWSAGALDPGPQICFAGRSNVGKSSLFNVLVNRKGLAKTSSTPGRTQELVLFSAEAIQAEVRVPFNIVDLPGYGYAKVPLAVKEKWGPMIEGYFKQTKELVCCIMLMDARRTISQHDENLLELMESCEVPILPVITKVDKIPKTQRRRELEKLAESLGMDSYKDLRAVSASKDIGIRELRQEIFDILHDWSLAHPMAPSDDVSE